MKTIILFGLIYGQVVFASEIPTLRFDDRITWKQIFDSGFRPKHLEGLERNTCVSQNQSFWLQFQDREPKFKLNSGSVDFNFSYDDFLQMIWHQGAEAITLEEGKHRADEFRKVFDGYIIQEITMPPLIDPSGLVDAGNDENNVKVRVGEYLIWYGFDNSMGKVKPIIPHFYIAWNFPGMPDVRLKDARDVVRPPKGYEWYSLDPKVNTPDPGVTPRPEPETVKPAVASKIPEVANEVVPAENPPVADTEMGRGRWIGLLAFLIIIGTILFRKFAISKSGHS